MSYSSGCPSCAGLGTLEATDIFCGAGGSSLGLEQVCCPACGRSLIRVVQAINHWDLAVEAHNANFPHADHDVHDVDEVPVARLRATPLLWASPECFPAGSLVLAERGLVPIEQIRTGDRVLTHTGRWRSVAATMKKKADTIIIKGGGHYGLEVTAQHPFYARRRARPEGRWQTQWTKRVGEEPRWVPAGDLDKDDYLAGPTAIVESLPMPPISGRPLEMDTQFWWLIGRWLGDGTVRYERHETVPLPPIPRRRSQPAGSLCVVCGGEARPDARSSGGRVSPYCSTECKRRNARPHARVSRGEIFITCGFHEADDLEESLQAVDPGLSWHRRDLPTGAVFATSHVGLAQWLIENFGKLAHGKTLPAWALTLPGVARRAMLDGYMSADGHVGRRSTASSVSKQLSLGVRLLALSVGEVASLMGVQVRGDTTIEGRLVRQRPAYRVGWTTDPDPNQARTELTELHRWFPIRSIDEGHQNVTVYNLSVEEDESYVVDGVVVHNCTHHAYCRGPKAGDESAQRSRATFNDIVRFSAHHRYDAVIVENVVEARLWCDTRGHRRNCSCGSSFNAWFGSMCALGYEGRIIYFNSQFALPTPQSRDRMYVVFWRAGARAPELDFRPSAWCRGCAQVVEGVQSFKRPARGSLRDQPGLGEWGRYGAQYLYRCPRCAEPVAPAVVGARTIIDWSLESTLIGERAKPLAAKTRARIKNGLERLAAAEPDPVPVGGQLFERQSGARIWALSGPGIDLPAGELRFSDTGGSPVAQARAPQPAVREFLIQVNRGAKDGHDRRAPHTLAEPTRTIAGHGELALVAFRNHGELRTLSEPTHTVTSGGLHHGLLVYNGNPGFVRPLADAAGTITSRDKQSLLVPYYQTGVAHQSAEPLATVTTRDREALVIGEEDVDACLFRMLQWPELLRAQVMDTLPDGRPYNLSARRRDRRGRVRELSNELRVRMIGNAVSAPVATMLGRAVADALR